jgi:hypothetical protein
MRIRITFWFWFLVISLIVSVGLFIWSEYHLVQNTVLYMPPCLAAVGLTFWINQKVKSSVITNLLSMLVLLLGYCLTMWTSKVLANSIIEFANPSLILDSMTEIVKGIADELKTIFFWGQSKITGKELEAKFIWPLTVLSIATCFLMLRTIWECLILCKKRTN